MPAYVTDVLKFSLKDSGSLCMLTYFAVFASTLLFGRLFSDLKSMYGLRVGTVRLCAMVIAFGVTSLLLVGASFITDRHAAFAVLLASQVLIPCIYDLFGFLFFVVPVPACISYSNILSYTTNCLLVDVGGRIMWVLLLVY